MKNAFSVGLYIKIFQNTPYVNDFQKLNNPGSGQFYPPFFKQVLHPSSSSLSSSSSSRSPSKPLRRSVTSGDLRSPQRR